ncbi:peptidoglycan recognition protein 4-like isoform X2 [Pararge aegeria]|nr:peptidoglycan recognition protein 4-like isoform X2 [Pararge aegeria]
MRPYIPPIMANESSWYGRGADDDVLQSVGATEETPLLQTVPRQQYRRNVGAFIVVGLLLVILLGGFAIGVYLLVLQNNAENILPPVEEMPIRHVNGSEWDQSDLLVLSTQPFHAETVIIEQTDTRECENLNSCVLLLREIKATFGVNNSLPYNFLVSSDGTAYEGLGWSQLSPLYPELSPLVLTFLGNFTRVPPPIEQVFMAKSLIAASLSKDFLNKNFTIIGKRTKEVPKYLFEQFKDFPRWKEE